MAITVTRALTQTTIGDGTAVLVGSAADGGQVRVSRAGPNGARISLQVNVKADANWEFVPSFSKAGVYPLSLSASDMLGKVRTSEVLTIEVRAKGRTNGKSWIFHQHKTGDFS